MKLFTLSEIAFALASVTRAAIASRLLAIKDLLFANAHNLLPR